MAHCVRALSLADLFYYITNAFTQQNAGPSQASWDMDDLEDFMPMRPFRRSRSDQPQDVCFVCTFL